MPPSDSRHAIPGAASSTDDTEHPQDQEDEGHVGIHQDVEEALAPAHAAPSDGNTGRVQGKPFGLGDVAVQLLEKITERPQPRTRSHPGPRLPRR